MFRRRSFAFASFALLALSAIGQAQIPSAPIAKEPPKARLTAIPIGAKQPADILHLAISLNYRDAAGMQRFVDAVSNPKSPNYRHFITPSEIGRRYGLPLSEVQKVTQFLKSQGMSIRLVGQNRLSILADATVAQAQSAFNISIQRYSVKPTKAVDNGERFAFTTPPEVPLSILPDIVDISGLENFTRPQLRNLTPTQLQGLYTVAPLYKNGMQGQGRTVAISNWDGFRITNEVLECQNFNLPVPTAGAGTNIQVVSIEGGNGIEGYEYGEGDLDIQASIEMAPLCNLIVYDNDEPSGNADLIGVLTKEADDDLADLITESYGWFLDIPTALAAHNLHVSMSAEGITYMVASGDSGTDLGGSDYPAIDPEVLTVGGTTAKVTAQNLRESEVGWTSSFGYEFGSGGGGWVASTDTFNIRAPYQLLPSFLNWSGVPSATAVPYRLIPDVSFNADPNTGYYVWFPSGSQIYGGTSGASPTCAGSLADTEEQLIADGYLQKDSNNHYRFGRIQDLLYSYSGNPAVFFDIVSGTNGNLPNGEVSRALPGWDFDSGWGPIQFAGFVAELEGIPQVGTLSLSATAVNGGTVVTGTITLTAPAASGGTIVNLASSQSNVTVPATITVPAGATSATFSVATGGVASEEQAVITAANGFGLQAVTVSVFPASFAALTVSPTAVAGGDTAAGTVSLNGFAPSGGYTISLSSDSSLATVPASVTIPANSSSATFPVKTSIVAKGGAADISGISSTSTTFSATLTIQTTAVMSVSVSNSTVIGGSDTVLTATLALDGPAKKGGDIVKLVSSDSKAATVPSTVTVPAGATSVSFTVTHHVVTTSETVNITGDYNGTSLPATVTVNPFQLLSVAANPSSISGTATASGLITLNAAPSSKSGPIVVKLHSSTKSVVVPATGSVPIGSTTGKFSISCKGVSTSGAATVTADYAESSQSATLSLSAPTLIGISVSPSSVTGSATTRVEGTVTISGGAPAGGFVVALSSSDSSAASVPATVTIPAGKSTVTFSVTHKAVTQPTTVTLSASANGSSQTTTLAVTP